MAPSIEPQESSLDWWVTKFYNIYGSENKHKLPEVLWLEVVDEASKLVESIRTGEYQDSLEQSAKFLAWVCAFAGKYLHQSEFSDDDPIGNSLQGEGQSYGGWILDKYPLACGICGEAQCHCPVHRHITEFRDLPEYQDRVKVLELGWAKAASKRHRELAQSNNKRRKEFLQSKLDDQIDKFVEIFEGPNLDQEIWKVAAHLLEEVGEVSREILYMSELKRLSGRLDDGEVTKEQIKTAVSNVHDSDHSVKDWSDATAESYRKVIEHEDEDKAIIDWLKGQCADRLKGELADLFSWLAALLNKLGNIRRAATGMERGQKLLRVGDYNYKLFSEHLEGRYSVEGRFAGPGCPACGQETCAPTCLLTSTMRETAKALGKRDRRQKLVGGT